MSRANPDQSAIVTLTKIVPAAPPVVFEAWLDPKALAKFMCPAEGSTVSEVEVDARVGGKFLIVMNVGGEKRPHQGEYLAIDRFERLAFTWRSAVAGPGSEVTLRFEPVGTAETKLTLEHVGLENELHRSQHESGWTRILGELGKLAGTPV